MSPSMCCPHAGGRRLPPPREGESGRKVISDLIVPLLLKAESVRDDLLGVCDVLLDTLATLDSEHHDDACLA